MPGDVKENAPAWAHAVAGQIGGMVGLAVVHPVDTVKIRMQARVSAPPVSAVSTVSSLVQREGPMALYRGIGAPMVASGTVPDCLTGKLFGDTYALPARWDIPILRTVELFQHF